MPKKKNLWLEIDRSVLPRVGCLLIVAAQLLIVAVRQSNAENAPTDIEILQERYLASVLPTARVNIDRLRKVAYQNADSLGFDGNWPDIQYADNQRAEWGTAQHLERTLVMAKAARLAENAGAPDANLEAKVIGALKAWTERDFQNPNWWWNQIGVPELLGEIATLMRAELSQAELRSITEIMRRADWRKGRWTGANLIWGVEIQIVRGCLENDLAAVTGGYDRMYEEIKIVSPTAEGIEPDLSFHQHGAQLQNGGYGLFYANDVARYIAFAWGTRFEVPPDRMAIFSSYLLDGEQWMIRGDVFDYSAIGRVITRQGFVALPTDWAVGPISPAGAAYSLGNAVHMLAAEPVPRQREFEAFARRLDNKPGAQELIGNKYFWCSDYMVHRGRIFMSTVKMLSNRMVNGEQVNGEGRKSEHLSDGVNLLYLTGDEYKDIFAVWDWTKLPGSTAIQGTLATGEKNPIGVRGTSSFAGGVSDGSYGLAAMDLERGKLTAKKAWFFFDNSYLSLGAGITLSDDADHDVVTDINQTLLNGAVMTSRSKAALDDGPHDYSHDAPIWVYHNHVGYVIGSGSRVGLSIGPQSGKWSDIGSGSSESVTRRVFNLWIDHGRSPDGKTYQYLVLPGASIDETIEQAQEPQIEVLANTGQIQAAWNARLKIAMMAFRQPGSLGTPLGKVGVDHSCLLMIRKIPQGVKLSAANPDNLPLVLHISVNAREAALTLPDDNFAGSTVTTTVLLTPSEARSRRTHREPLGQPTRIGPEPNTKRGRAREDAPTQE